MFIAIGFYAETVGTFEVGQRFKNPAPLTT
jgi:hypothetical protein